MVPRICANRLAPMFPSDRDMAQAMSAVPVTPEPCLATQTTSHVSGPIEDEAGASACTMMVARRATRKSRRASSTPRMRSPAGLVVVYWDPSARRACALGYAPSDAYEVYVQIQHCREADVAGDVCTPASSRPGDYATQERSGSAGPVSLTIAPAGMFGVAAAFTGPHGSGSWVLGFPSHSAQPSLANGGPTLLDGLGAYRP